MLAAILAHSRRSRIGPAGVIDADRRVQNGHGSIMIGTLLSLLAVLLGFHAWAASLRAREIARERSRELCAAAGVQLLDQTVALRRLRIERAPLGGLRLMRCYAFEVSTDGSNRLHGSLDLADGIVIAWDVPGLPTASGAVAARSGNVIEVRPPRRLH